MLDLRYLKNCKSDKSFIGGAAHLNSHTVVMLDSCHSEAQPKNLAYVRYIYFDSQMFRFAQHDRVERRFLRRSESEKCRNNLFCGGSIVSGCLPRTRAAPVQRWPDPRHRLHCQRRCLGGLSGTLDVHHSKPAGMVGAYAYELRGYEHSRINILGGSLDWLWGYDSSQVYISGGSIHDYLYSHGSSQVDISGGSIDSLNSLDSSQVNISGGSIGYYLNSLGSSQVNISGGSIGGAFHQRIRPGKYLRRLNILPLQLRFQPGRYLRWLDRLCIWDYQTRVRYKYSALILQLMVSHWLRRTYQYLWWQSLDEPVQAPDRHASKRRID